MDEEKINDNEEFSSIDDIGIDLPDIPMPDENAQSQEIEDEFELLGESPNIIQLKDGRKVIE